jgi:TonB family protein
MQGSLSSFLVLPLFLASPAFAQLPRIAFSGGLSGGPDGIKGDATFSLTRPIQLMANAPYSGEEKTESVQTLADGTHITRTMPVGTQKVWRDSQGRVCIEQDFGGGQYHPTIIQIEDPVAGYIYVMDDITKVAHRVKASVIQERNVDPLRMRQVPVGGGDGGGGVAGDGGAAVMAGLPPEAGAAAGARLRPQISAPEDLGTQTIDGLSVHGSRITTVIPTGAQGNDGPITTTRDSWYSPELNMIIRTVSNDPRSGTQTMGIANLTRNDPDPNSFMVPADYATVDENSTFTIKWDTNVAEQISKVTLSPARSTNLANTFKNNFPVTAPILIHKIEAGYTQQAREAKVQGTVLLQVKIDATGAVDGEQIKVLRGLGFGLDEKAVEAVKQWKFKPATKAGTPVAAPANIEVNFRL